ncbi:hypothetical protein Clacol_009303 [Clathrus columnatus]|uniref:Uncharacterized protein n=1 Tax=Clathrus columnatus TaxID=1419009 RepID=A0AAV5AK78_9AGAM|nr:hypothetical protein Clacol_009303 [Clathrus columnatus]
MAQCGREGIPVSFALDLPPPAAALVKVYTRQSEELRRNQAIFLGLQIAGGHIGLPIVLTFAVLSRRVRRDPTFLNFCITWIFSSVVFSLLLYRGMGDNTVVNSLGEVEPNICLAQAALTGGAQVMTAGSTLSLIIRLWLGFRAAIYGDECPSAKKSFTNAINAGLLIVPYVFFITFALASVFVGMGRIDVDGTSLQRVIPTNFYCTVVAPNSLIVVAVADGTILRVPPKVGSEGQGESLAVTFGLPVWVDMLQAAIPLIGTLVLGISSDMISTLMFWRRDINIDTLDSGFEADTNYIDVPDISNSREKGKNVP